MEPFAHFIVPKLAPWITSLVLVDLIIMAAHSLTFASLKLLQLVIIEWYKKCIGSYLIPSHLSFSTGWKWMSCFMPYFMSCWSYPVPKPKWSSLWSKWLSFTWLLLSKFWGQPQKIHLRIIHLYWLISFSCDLLDTKSFLRGKLLQNFVLHFARMFIELSMLKEFSYVSIKSTLYIFVGKV